MGPRVSTGGNARRWLRRAVLLGTPLTLGLLEVFHPVGRDLLADLGPRVEWFIALHVLQLPLFGLMAVALWLLLPAGASGRAPAVNRLGAWGFAVCYPAFDAIAGIAVGLAVQQALGADPQAQRALLGLAATLSFSPVTLALAVSGGLGFMAAGAAAAVALARAGAPRGALACLVLGSLVFGFNHTPPFGPVGLLLFLAGTAWLELGGRAGHAPVSPAAPLDA
jgi:hypothetical protein